MENAIDYEMDFGGDVSDEPEAAEPEYQEDPELSAEPESEEDEDSERNVKKSNRMSGKYRINQIQKEKYQALDEANRLREENEELRRMYDFSLNAAQSSHDERAVANLERARQLKEQAIEAGDVKAQVDADIELAAATNEIMSINNYKAQQAYQNQQAPHQQSNQPPHIANARQAEEWVNKNSWLNPNSPDYDESIASEVQIYSDMLDANLYRAGLQDKIMSKEYFNELNEAVRAIRERGGERNSQPRSNLNMKPSRSPVSPVRNGLSERAAAGKATKLTPTQRDWAKRLKITEAQYIQAEAKSRRDQPQSWDRTR